MNEIHRAKPRSLKPSIKRLIFTRAVTERTLPREYLANQLIKEIKELGEIPPTLETAKKYISAARNTDNPIDKTWSLGACRDYPQYFPPNSVSFLWSFIGYECQMYAHNDIIYLPKFSIRKAIWMVRLEPFLGKFILSDNDFFTIDVISGIYSSGELASETMGEDKFDSSELDAYLRRGDLDGILQYDPEAKKNKAKIIDSKPLEQKEDEL